MTKTVASYDDLVDADLSDRGKDRVLQAVREHPYVAHLEAWLAEEKPLEPLEGASTLFAVESIDAETAKAWRVVQPDGPAEWIPKSCASVYEAADDGVDTASPQQRLEAWGGEP